MAGINEHVDPPINLALDRNAAGQDTSGLRGPLADAQSRDLNKTD